jgi:hypothetical protein
MSATPQLYKPHDQVPETGAYFARHAREHCGWPKAILEANRVFPACPTCGSSIRYALGRTSVLTNNEAAGPENRIRAMHV